MALVLYSGIKPKKVTVHGNWFEFKPGQIKNMDDVKVHFLTVDRSHEGFVGVPDMCGDLPLSDEAKKAIAVATTQGRENLIRELERVKYNLVVSLQRDFDKANIKADALAEATPGEMEALEHLAALKKEKTEDGEKRAGKVRELLGIDGNANKSNAK